MRLRALLAAIVLALPGVFAMDSPAQANPVEYCRWLQNTTKPYYSNCDDKPNFYPGDSDEYQFTNILYDAGTTAFAWSHCDRPGIGLARGGTSSY